MHFYKLFDNVKSVKTHLCTSYDGRFFHTTKGFLKSFFKFCDINKHEYIYILNKNI